MADRQMHPTLRRLVAPSLLAIALGAVVVIPNLPKIRVAYWEWLAEGKGPNRHGADVLRFMPANTPYDRWLVKARPQMPYFEGIVIQHVDTMALQPWPAMGEGVRGLYLRLADYQITAGRILELPVDGRTRPQRQMFEQVAYVLGGRGHTEFHRDGLPPLRVNWKQGSLVSIPLNVRYQHFSDGGATARLLAVTSFPFVINSMASESFVLDVSFDFTDRFGGGEDYFTTTAPAGDRRIATNFVPDVGAEALQDAGHRAAGAQQLAFAMTGNTQLDLHVTEIPPMTYAKAHRHTSDAFVLILGGNGYSLIWRGDDIKHRRRIDWQKGTLFAPPTYWYHQHLNAGSRPSRHLAINAPTLVQNLGLRFGDQIESESREIRNEWRRELEHRHAGAD